MKKQLISLIIISLLIFCLIPFNSVSMKDFSSNSKSNTNLLKGGWLEIQDGVRILHVSGDHYEMGYQHGYLLKDECQQNLRAFLSDASSSVSYEQLLDMWYEMEPFIPTEYLNELHGIADGADTCFEDLAAAYMTIPWGDRGCFGFAASGSATIDGDLYHARSFDLPYLIKDNESGNYVYENSVLIIRNPDDGYPSVAPSIAGSATGGGGFNTEGISIGTQVCWSSDYTYSGTPMMIRILMVLDHASSLDEAVNIINTNRTMGYNFIISDAYEKKGVAVEQNANDFYVGFWNNETEENPPFWQLDDVIRRTNFFIDPTIADTQRDSYKPNGFINFIKLVLRTDIFFAVWMNYKVTSTEIEKKLGKLDVNTSLQVLRDAYSGKTNLLLFIIKKLAYGTSFLEAWNQWATNAKTGDFSVSFASREKNACESEIHFFNLNTLLSAQPP